MKYSNHYFYLSSNFMHRNNLTGVLLPTHRYFQRQRMWQNKKRKTHKENHLRGTPTRNSANEKSTVFAENVAAGSKTQKNRGGRAPSETNSQQQPAAYFSLGIVPTKGDLRLPK